MIRLNDRWFRLAGIPLIALLGDWIFYDAINRQHGWPFWIDYLVSLVEVSLLWTISRYGIYRSRRRYPTLSQTRQRVIFQALWLVFITGLFRLTTATLYDLTFIWGYHYTPLRYLYNVAVGIFCVIPIAAIYEGLYLYRQWRMTYYEAEELKKMALQTQLESLREQVKPHFLFNSLNTLSSLIRKDVDRAEAFLDELSKVYRYLLRTNEGELTDLATELQFIQSFFHLMKTRYGNALQMELDINEETKSRLLPPLTLQLLVENAIKHNRIDKSHPLVIKIETDQQGRLLVKNNLQKKVVSVPSNKIGLGNIAAKYTLLGQPGIGIMENETDFIVIIPLLKTYEYEHTDRRR